ncbi:hypothetical protein CHUAL_006781 [Chamberlinius hualienensis]
MASKLLLLIFSLTFNAICLLGQEKSSDDVKLWAVLVAGSNFYGNYRHQADICHAYQILHKHGIPDEQIIVFMFDDIAYSPANPTKGIIVNHVNGSDVYHGVVKDYIGMDVTPKNFLNVLLGKSEEMAHIGTGKVLKSGPNDHVFINFADHGATGLVAFPDEELYAKDLIATLEAMNKKNMYNKLVFYMEACESGSMFDKILKSNLNIFATTAASTDESSFACYWDDLREAYLGDFYSVYWMEDTDNNDITKETLQSQFLNVKQETNMSHPQEYGDLRIGKMTVAEFQGKKVTLPKQKKIRTQITDAVPSREVPMETLRRRLQAAKLSNRVEDTISLQKQIFKLESNRKFLLEKVKRIIRRSVVQPELIARVWHERLELNDLDCHKNVVSYFSENCFKLSKNDYSLKYVYVFANMCELGIKPKAMKKAMDVVCTFPSVQEKASEDVKIWGVLVATSFGWGNYRHQADICHAYQILHKHGVPDERIVVFMYDDLAYNDLNPFPGMLVNQINGTDVYTGVVRDYVGKDITPGNFLNVLAGKSEEMAHIGSGKVLKSGPNDHVFIYFADHGATGLLVFPTDVLLAKDLMATFETMKKNQMYNKLVIYVEACESATMFRHLQPNISILGITSTNEVEPAYACDWDETRRAFVGDDFSVYWMEDSDHNDITKETLQTQFLNVKREMTRSHPQEIGDLSIGNLTVSEFQGKKVILSKEETFKSEIRDRVPSHEVPMESLRRRLEAAKVDNGVEDIISLQKQIFKLESNRKFLLEKIKEIVRRTAKKPELIKSVWEKRLALNDLNCHEDVVMYFSENCFNLSKNDYSLKYVYIFVNMCEMGIKSKTMKKVMDVVCTHPPVYGIH